MKKKLILGSTSRYRAELLGRLQVPFETAKPDVDEKALAGESPADTAARLSVAKAQAVASRFPQAVVIGSDQVADLAGRHIGKPGTRDAARAQLRDMRGQELVFHSGLAVLDGISGALESAVVATTVRFRDYRDDEIERYLDREDALDCAGSAKSEGLGIALVSRLQSDDPTALVGLPLITLSAMLRRAGIDVLG